MHTTAKMAEIIVAIGALVVKHLLLPELHMEEFICPVPNLLIIWDF